MVLRETSDFYKAGCAGGGGRDTPGGGAAGPSPL